MSNKKLIGGGFPGIRYCIDEKNIITKESRERREFSVRKIIPISKLLARSPRTSNPNENIKSILSFPQESNTQSNSESESEQLTVKESVLYDTISNIVHNTSSGMVENADIDLNLINGPVRKIKENN